MANNRLYLRDTETGEEIVLAKGYAGSGGWTLRSETDSLCKWLDEHDFGSSIGGHTKLVVYDENHPPVGTEIAKIEHLLAINESLRREVRLQRQEIAALREERKMLLDADRPNLDGGWLT
jgi:hypothetical protein